jgi:Kelch motif
MKMGLAPVRAVAVSCVLGLILICGRGASIAASQPDGRIEHPAPQLPNGKVLVVVGYNHSRYLASAERYEPTTNTWSSAANLASPRDNHTATLLRSCQVLVAGGMVSATTTRVPNCDVTPL